jgi:hypothetical protein
VTPYHVTNNNRINEQGNSVMRAITFSLAFTLVLSGVSVAGSTDTLPNAGLFVFNATPVAFVPPVLVASR